VETESNASRRPLRVFVAEDDEDMRALIAQTLQHDGYEVISSRDGQQLLERLQDAMAAPLSMPDVVITDILMPRYSGLGILSAMRQAGWETPVIILSALKEEDVGARARALGATAFFRKPFDMNDLRTAILSVASGALP
jgi:DNA-binding response OmpR family regulator